MPVFSYSPIDLSTDAIRLVRLCKDSFYNDIHCELVETFLRQVGGIPYDALSYTWAGDPSDPSFNAGVAQITMNGEKVSVTGNLLSALRHLRSRSQDRMLWIDALCIDQANDEEKEQQVGQMRLVYQHADNVLIWLELGSDGTDSLMYSDRRLAAGLSVLLARPWFQRVWVLQEVACARVATVVCGVHSVSTRTFVMLPSVWRLEVDPHVRAVLELMPGPMRKDSSGSGFSENDRTLAALLKKFEHSKASVKLDRIYALLGISSDASDPVRFPPVYSLTEEEVVFDTMLFFVLGYTKNSILCPSFAPALDFSDARHLEMRGRSCTVTDLIQALKSPTPLWTYFLDWAVLEHQDKLVASLLGSKIFETDLSSLGVVPTTPLVHMMVADMMPRHVEMYDQLLEQVVEPRDGAQHQAFLCRLGQLRSRVVARTTLFRFVNRVLNLNLAGW
ncbi:HET-domain-containing protein [Apiospora rasikravindrae]|uniref:HET-domain-containing protein n=1 Tax=Apiospora rasikravindrae TaxID=990691 RepID=A0ABR1SP55_9PEZI